MRSGFTREQRADILGRRHLADEDFERVKDAVLDVPLTDESRARLRASKAMVERCDAEYRAGLPVVVMSTCPYCGKPLERTFDPFDLDGEWWRGIRLPGPEPCAHYAFLKGAVRFGEGRKPTRPETGEAMSGPEVPYVIPKLLEQPTTIAVIGELPMDPGWLAYAITYYATQHPPADKGLSGDWALESYSYDDPLTGLGQFRYSTEVWDFDLRPWIARGKLRWCVPGSDNRVLADPKTACPYVDLPGERRQLKLGQWDQVWYPTPDGLSVDPFGCR